tara:strand:+ start:133 stop:306 length:174 start_codon:yes stop_codon:yes gene_type:complete
MWSAITVNKRGEFSHSFSFVSSHDKRLAFKYAQEQTALEVIAIIPGDHPVYAPSLDV